MRHPTQRALALALSIFAWGAAAPVAAQGFPAKPMRWIVPSAPGDGSDITGRILAERIGRELGQQVVVDNKPGAGGVLGSELAAKAPADGYTMIVGNAGSHGINAAIYTKLNYDVARDFVPVALFCTAPNVMVASPGTPVRTVAEFVAYAKANAGKLNYASSGPGTPYHMAGELFKAMSGTNIVHVPHKASGDARSSIIGGHVQMMFDAVTTMASNVTAGQVRALGTSGAKRTSVMPNVPTISEAGVPGYDATIWLGLMAPAGTPKPVVDKLNAEVARIIARDDIKGAWAKQGASPMQMTPADFDAFLKKDIEKWAKVVQLAGLRN